MLAEPLPWENPADASSPDEDAKALADVMAVQSWAASLG